MGHGNNQTRSAIPQAAWCQLNRGRIRRLLGYYGVALKYEYPLSKRTSVYGGTGWYKAKVDYSADDVYKEEGYQAYLGLTHCF
ncbi:hypothetical protein HMPREF9465_02186 [Sutterella wadsworthensis 2_1_59BFAA]|uniref:Uncharacterized protein n=1 Tax=Sutterella wadsworthensis 2_1_59BFAA TaxID=742823 RepID=K1KEN6_9BURK|nr:hypothetical protein HMPREF9465_02186 [Sutterella wadsworthensis 2_1_59BFAA]